MPWVLLALAVAASPFEGRERVRVEELFAALRGVAHELEQAETVRSDFAQLVQSHGLASTPGVYRDYVRVRLAFETTRGVSQHARPQP